MPVDGEVGVDETCADCPYQCETCDNTFECLTCNAAKFREDITKQRGDPPENYNDCVCE